MKNSSWKYWLIPVFLIICQSVWTFSSTSQIRYEEIAESVRNVFWLQNQVVYDGISTNVGWYGTLLILYKIFGFSLFTAKYYRLFLFAISIFCLAITLKKYLGERSSVIPLLVIGLSPTFLYFTTFQTSYGIDISYLLICIYLLDKIVFKFYFRNLIWQIIFWLIAMISWMSYPSLAFYLPAFWIIYIIKLIKSPTNFSERAGYILISLSAFLLPLIISFLYIKNSSILWYDQNNMSGIFRGAGTFIFDSSNWIKNIYGFSTDIFYTGSSYNFEILKGDFSGYYPVLTVCLTIIFSLYLLVKVKKLRILLICIWLTLIICLIFGNLAFDPTLKPGIRRNTAGLAAFYGLFITTWFYVIIYFKHDVKRIIFIAILCLIPIHHILVFPANLSYLSKPSIFQYKELMIKGGPVESLKYYISQAQNQELFLSCQNNMGKKIFCRYVEIYAAVAGSCLWNNLECRQILGYDDKKNEFIPLSTKLWETYYFSH